jgi:predicted ATP-grasp superfamily ATP-dependent carboligase
MMNIRTYRRATSTPTPVIILGVEHPRAVAVVQSLGRMGVPVIGVDHNRAAPGMYSRYVKKKILVSEKHDTALEALESLAGRPRALLIATSDHYLALVSQNFERLSRRFILTTPPWEVNSTLMDKRRCYALARSIELNVPRFFAPASVEELDRVIAWLDFANHDYILTKPLPTGEPTDGSTGRFTRVAGLDAETVRARSLEIMARTGDLPMISEVIPGQSDACIGVSLILDRNHDVVAWYCVKRLQLRPYKKDEGFIHPYELGANVYCESTHDDEAVKAASRLLRAVGYYGVATVEFRRDANNGSLRLVKVDPRFVRATSLSAALGIDLPAVLFRVFTGKSVAIPESYPDGVAWVWLSWYLDTIQHQGLNIAWRRPIALIRDAGRIRAAAYFSNRDPVPFIKDVRRGVTAYIKGGLTRVARRVSTAPGHHPQADS